MLFLVVGSCCAKFETSQTFSYVQTDAATLNIVGHGQETPKLVRTFVTRNVQAARNNEVRD